MSLKQATDGKPTNGGDARASSVTSKTKNCADKLATNHNRLPLQQTTPRLRIR